MKLSFGTQKLRRTCLDRDYAVKNLGIDLASSLQARLADLDAAEHIVDVPLGIDLTSSTLSNIPIHILDDHYIIGHANHVTVWNSGKADAPWDMVSRVKLTQIQELPR